MPAFSKVEWKSHERALNCLKQNPGTLSLDDRDFLLNHWNPQVSHNVGSAGAFFTPEEIAQELMAVTLPRGRVINIFAGIGRLAYTAKRYAEWENIELTCVEVNPEFVEVGKRILPEATWITGNCFDEKLIKSLGHFDYVLANPPFGRPQTLKGTDTRWLVTKSYPAEVMALEIGMHLADDGAFIIPAPSHALKKDKEGKEIPTRWDLLPARGDTAQYSYADYCPKRREWQREKGHGHTMRLINPNYALMPLCTDVGDIKWNGASPSVELVKYTLCQ